MSSKPSASRRSWVKRRFAGAPATSPDPAVRCGAGCRTRRTQAVLGEHPAGLQPPAGGVAEQLDELRLVLQAQLDGRRATPHVAQHGHSASPRLPAGRGPGDRRAVHHGPDLTPAPPVRVGRRRDPSCDALRGLLRPIEPDGGAHDLCRAAWGSGGRVDPLPCADLRPQRHRAAAAARDAAGRVRPPARRHPRTGGLRQDDPGRAVAAGAGGRGRRGRLARPAPRRQRPALVPVAPAGGRAPGTPGGRRRPRRSAGADRAERRGHPALHALRVAGADRAAPRGGSC